MALSEVYGPTTIQKVYTKKIAARYYRNPHLYFDTAEGFDNKGEKMLDGNQEGDIYGATHVSITPDTQQYDPTAVVPAAEVVVTVPEVDDRYKCEQLHSTPRAEVLEEAKQHITGDRNASYGPPTQDFQRTADMWTALLQLKLKPGERIRSQDVAWMMIMLKASRAQHSGKRDNYVDAAGYAGCGWECEMEEEEKDG